MRGGGAGGRGEIGGGEIVGGEGAMPLFRKLVCGDKGRGREVRKEEGRGGGEEEGK